MVRKLFFLLPFVVAGPLLAQQFGKSLTLKEQTKISDILHGGNALDGKLVQVRGTIVEVCPKKGCFIIIRGDQKHQTIMFKVEDGIIRFGQEIKGHEVVAEGKVFAPKAAAEDCADGCADHQPKTRINGLGAVVQK